MKLYDYFIYLLKKNRWHDCLDPKIKKGNWKPEEDKLILDMYSKIGSKWTRVSSQRIYLYNKYCN